MNPGAKRPPFIVSTSDVPEEPTQYPKSTEALAPWRTIGKAAGLRKIGINIVRVPPGARTSWPHAEEAEEEFVYVLEGEIDAWIDGEIFPMTAGDLAAFPAGTGISHAFINNSAEETLLLVGGEADKPGARIFYPLHPVRREQMAPERWWGDVPARTLGPHDGMSDVMRERGVTGSRDTLSDGGKPERSEVAD